MLQHDNDSAFHPRCVFFAERATRFSPFSARLLVVVLEILTLWLGPRCKFLKQPIYEICTSKGKLSPQTDTKVRHIDQQPTSRTVFHYWRKFATALVRRLVAWWQGKRENHVCNLQTEIVWCCSNRVRHHVATMQRGDHVHLGEMLVEPRGTSLNSTRRVWCTTHRYTGCFSRETDGLLAPYSR